MDGESEIGGCKGDRQVEEWREVERRYYDGEKEKKRNLVKIASKR